MSQAVDLELLQIFFEDANDALTEWERVCLKMNPSDDTTAIEPLLRFAHNLKGGAGMVGLTDMHRRLHKFEDYLTSIKKRNLKLSSALVDALLELEHFLRGWMANLKSDPRANPDSSSLEKKFEIIISGGEVTSPTSPTERFDPPSNLTTENESRALKKTAEVPPSADETLRVSAAKLDQLIQLIGELSLHHAILDRASREGTMNTQSIRAVMDVKSKLTQDLQDTALSLRMVPVEGLLQRAERVARETAVRLKKSVNVIRKGDEVNLDKVVVERMHEPMIHLARNAIDHGIETPENRVQSGKSPIGNLRIVAETSTSGVTIIFEDDGRGIDGDAVRRKAIEKGLISEGQEISESGKLQLIFLPGLSTAEEISEISGRGVGMDVVAEAVRKLGGRIDVSTSLGKGTRFTISLPTNLSIVDALVVRVQGCQYAIPNQELSEVVNLREISAQSVKGGRGHVINLRGMIVPIESMASFLRHSALPGTIRSDTSLEGKPAIVVKFRDNLLALAIDEVVGQQQVFVRPVISSLATVVYFGGSTILSDGEPAMILNLGEIARKYFDLHS